MIFTTFVSQSEFIIEAHLENDSEKSGFLNEGSYRPIQLIDDCVQLKFDYIPLVQHPDIIALICLCAFYPYIKDNLTFPFPVSENCKNAICRFTDTINDEITRPNISVQNWDKSIIPYKGSDKSIISFGGGMDSLTLSLLFPDSILVNQLDSLEQKKPMVDLFSKLQKTSETAITSFCNIRSINQPYGFSGWTCCYLTPLLVAMDKGANEILTGGILGAVLMFGTGRRFNQQKFDTPYFNTNDDHLTKWPQLFNAIGIKAYSPVAGISEMLTSKLIVQEQLEADVLYCQKEEGKPCHKCPKCFRKNLELEFWEYQKDNTQRPSKYWEQYNNEVVKRHFHNDYRDLGYIFNLLSQSLPFQNKPIWFQERVPYCNANTAWSLRYYSKALELVPKERKVDIEKVLNQHFQKMSLEESLLLEQYDCVNYSYNDFNSTIFLEKGRVDYYKEIDKENTLLKEQSRQLTNTLGYKLLKKLKNLLHK